MCTLSAASDQLKSTFLSAALGSVLTLAAVLPAGAQGYPLHVDLGTTPSPDELARMASIPPDGRGLPPGQGTYAQGQKIYAESCAACHGDQLQGIPTAGDKLIGGRGTLATEAPVKTVESYWPYSTTLFDYVKRAMPLSAPGSLKNDEIYAVTAFILGEAKIIDKSAVMDARALPAVEMPNRNGFVPDPRPEIELYR